MNGRDRDKDAYDIVYCLKHYPGGLDAIIAEFTRFRGHGLVREAMGYLSEAFRNVEYNGPAAWANFKELPPGEDRDLALREATELVLALVRRVLPD